MIKYATLCTVLLHCHYYPPEAIPDAVVEIQDETDSDSTHITNLRKLIAYIQRQWVTKRGVGPSRLSVRDNRSTV